MTQHRLRHNHTGLGHPNRPHAHTHGYYECTCGEWIIWKLDTDLPTYQRATHEWNQHVHQTREGDPKK